MTTNDDRPEREHLDLERESLDRRRSRAVAASRGGFRQRARRPVYGIIFVMFVIVPLAYAGAWLATFARLSSRFEVTDSDVTLEGNKVVSRQEIRDSLGMESSVEPNAAPGMRSGANAFRLSLDEKRRQIEAIPWVRSAMVARAYPHRLDVRVVERKPVAFVNTDGRVKLIDADGVILEKPDRGAFDFPVLEGVGTITAAAERQSRVALFQQFINDWRAEGPTSGWMLSEVDVADAEDLKALLVQGQDTILVHFGHQDFAQRFHTFLVLLPEVRQTTPKIDSVDLRFRGQLIVNPDTPKPPAPLAGREARRGTIAVARLAVRETAGERS